MLEPTTVIRIRPGVDEVVLALHVEASKLRHYADIRVIATNEDIKLATDDLGFIARLKKTIEEKRKEYIDPINEHLKAINEAFKEFTEPLGEADRIIRGKILTYRQEQDRLRAEQERINELRIEAAKAEMELKGELTEPVGLVEVVPEAPNRYRAEAALLGKAMIAKFEVVDFSLLPEEYKMVDATKLGKVVRAGLRSISGVRIWEEESLRVTTARGE